MLLEIHTELGIPSDYGQSGMPPRFEEATDLVDAGPNLMGRMIQLDPLAVERWKAMSGAALEAGIVLLMVSGYRSYDYQAGLIRRKLEAGQAINDILRVNAAPGYSEHHTGRAIDIATPGCRPLIEEFDSTPAFAWLQDNAQEFGFRMSYPRGNSHGFIYEPWHWATGLD